jgi:hypothetical protein
MKKLLPGLQDNNNSDNYKGKLLLMLGGLQCKVVGMEVMVLAVEEEEAVEIEELNMLIPMMGTKDMILNSTEMMTIGIKGVMHVIEKMKRGLANLNLQCLNLLVGLIQKLISHGSYRLIRFFICIIILKKRRWQWQPLNLMTML